MNNLNRVMVPVYPLEQTGIEGMLSIGPLPADCVDRLAKTLNDNGLQVSSEGLPDIHIDDVSFEDATPAIHLTISGQGVLGYFVDEDGAEASGGEVAGFIEDLLDGAECTVVVEGSHLHPDGSRITTRLHVAVKDGDHNVVRVQEFSSSESRFSF